MNADGSCYWCPFLKVCKRYVECPHRPEEDEPDTLF